MRGKVRDIAGAPSLKAVDAAGAVVAERDWPRGEGPTGHKSALAAVIDLVDDYEVVAVGHRVVHGGLAFTAPVRITPRVHALLSQLIALAPLHQPHNLKGVEAAQAAFPDAVQIACFDTSFHRGHPWAADTFALPRRFYDEGVRRYGFHGLSYEYIAAKLAREEPTLAAGGVVVAHLGNGASMCGLRAGRSMGSTMGFTALDGLPMGARCGQIDPGVVLYLMTEKAMTAAEVTDLLYNQSGLKGLSGLTHDMRTLEAAGTTAAEEAIGYFTYRVRREIGAMAAILGGVDGIVFTGGIGENSARVRRQSCEGLEWMGVTLDAAANAAGARVISAPASRVRVLALATDEEAMIAAHVAQALAQA